MYHYRFPFFASFLSLLFKYLLFSLSLVLYLCLKCFTISLLISSSFIYLFEFLCLFNTFILPSDLFWLFFIYLLLYSLVHSSSIYLIISFHYSRYWFVSSLLVVSGKIVATCLVLFRLFSSFFGGIFLLLWVFLLERYCQS